MVSAAVREGGASGEVFVMGSLGRTLADLGRLWAS